MLKQTQNPCLPQRSRIIHWLTRMALPQIRRRQVRRPSIIPSRSILIITISPVQIHPLTIHPTTPTKLFDPKSLYTFTKLTTACTLAQITPTISTSITTTQMNTSPRTASRAAITATPSTLTPTLLVPGIKPLSTLAHPTATLVLTMVMICFRVR